MQTIVIGHRNPDMDSICSALGYARLKQLLGIPDVIAARAGNTGLVPNGDTLSPTDAHFSMLTQQIEPARRTQRFNANAFRLVHTLGNVREWVADGWAASDATRVVRGGSYVDGAARLRFSLREWLPLSTRDAVTGFRIVRELP